MLIPKNANFISKRLKIQCIKQKYYTFYAISFKLKSCELDSISNAHWNIKYIFKSRMKEKAIPKNYFTHNFKFF